MESSRFGIEDTSMMPWLGCPNQSLILSEQQLLTQTANMSLTKLSREYRENYHSLICAVLCLFGIATNLANILVLTRPAMRSTVNHILAAIAICDTGYMTTYLIYVLHFYLLNRDSCYLQVFTLAWLYFILIHSLGSIYLHSLSLWLAVLLAFVRLTVIKKIRFGYEMLNFPSLLKAISGMALVLMVFWSPALSVQTIQRIPAEPWGNCFQNISDHEFMYIIVPSEIASQNGCFLLRTTLLIMGIVFKLIPCLLVALLICGIMRSIQKAKARNKRVLRQSSTSLIQLSSTRTIGIPSRRSTGPGPPPANPTGSRRSAYTSRTTNLLLAILIIFLITEIPQALLGTLGGMYPTDMYFFFYNKLGDIFDLLSLLNSSVNFILYCAMSSRFRSAFAELFIPNTVKTLLARNRACSNSDILPDLGLELTSKMTGRRQSRLNVANGTNGELIPLAPVQSF